MKSPAGDSSESDLVITRVFDAPRELVWKAWTEPELFRQWWGPKSFTSPVARLDVRVGGKYHVAMRSPEGQDFWSTGTYREVVKPERLVLTDSFADAQGNVVPASHYGMTGDWPLEQLMTITLDEQDGRTTLTLRYTGAPAGEELDLAAAGWNEMMDKLAALLKDMR